jgi:hypothetical protein
MRDEGMERKVSALLDNTTSPQRLGVGVVRFSEHVEIVFLDAQRRRAALKASLTPAGYIELWIMDEEYTFVTQDDGSVLIEPTTGEG